MSNVLRTALEYCHYLVVSIGTGGVLGGAMKMVQNTIGIWLNDYDLGDQGVFITFGDKVVLPKQDGSTITQGEFLYYNDTTHVVCGGTYAAANPGEYYRVGIARDDAASAATTVVADFYGNDYTFVLYT